MAEKNLRQTWREGADEASPGVLALWKETLEGANKKYVHEIKCKCGFRHREEFTIPDLKARADAAKALMEFGWGRPGTVEPERTDLVTRDAGELTADERAQLLAEVQKRLEKGAVNG